MSNRITTPQTNIYANLNTDTSIIGYQNDLTNQDTFGVGDHYGVVIGIVLNPTENVGSVGLTIGGQKLVTTPDYSPTSTPLGYICALRTVQNDSRSPIMEPFPEMPPPDSPEYLNCLKAYFPKYFFKLRVGHTYEPVHIGSDVVVGYTNNLTKTGGMFKRSLEIGMTMPNLGGGPTILAFNAGIHPPPGNHRYLQLAARLGLVHEMIVGVGWSPAAGIALSEHATWTKPDGGFFKETDVVETKNQHLRDALGKYWSSIVGEHLQEKTIKAWGKIATDFKTLQPTNDKDKKRLYNIADKNMWSAAYVSWCLKNSGFKGASYHGGYAAFNNGKDGHPWRSYSLLGGNHERIVVQIGDVVLKASPGRGVAAGHGDFVYKIEDNKAWLSGGNIKGNKAGLAKKMPLNPENNTLKDPQDKVLIVKKMT